MNYYPFHVGDFRAGTVNMSRQARWIYRDMLDVYYDTEKQLPLDFELLCDMIGVESDEDRRVVERVLRLKFVKTDYGYTHDICDKVIAEYHKKADAAKTNGKLGGRPKKANANPEKPSGLSLGSYQVPLANPDLTGSKANQEPRTNNQEPEEKVKSAVEAKPSTARRRTDPADDSVVIFEYWQRVMDHPHAKLDAKRVRAIKARLSDGYSVAELCRAVDGCKLSPHHMGQNDTRTIYDDIELICRDGPKVDKFIKCAERGPSNGRSTNAQLTIDNLQAYLEAHEN